MEDVLALKGDAYQGTCPIGIPSNRISGGSNTLMKVMWKPCANRTNGSLTHQLLSQVMYTPFRTLRGRIELPIGPSSSAPGPATHLSTASGQGGSTRTCIIVANPNKNMFADSHTWGLNFFSKILEGIYRDVVLGSQPRAYRDFKVPWPRDMLVIPRKARTERRI